MKATVSNPTNSTRVWTTGAPLKFNGLGVKWPVKVTK